MTRELILVVDDDASLVNLLQEDLRAEGYDVVEAYDGQSALSLAATRRPRLIVIDMNMPGLTGMETVTRLREQEQDRQTPVILLTGESASNLAGTHPTADRVTHVEKPVDLDRLNAIVKACLLKYPI